MDDFESLHKILSDSKSMKHYPRPFTREKSIKWIEWNIENYVQYGFGLWAVILKENDKFIGDCGITMQEINSSIVPEIGYHINKDYTNKGYATEAARACRNYAFEILNMQKIYSYMKETNTASQKVAKNNGMKLENKIVNDKNELTTVYSITLEDYLNLGN